MLWYIEENISFKKGKGVKSKAVIALRELSNDQDDFGSAKQSAPHILVIVENNSLHEAYILGDGCTIKCETGDFSDALILLLGTYIFDLAYPRDYSQILGFLQQHVLKDPYILEKSADYKHFVAQYRSML